MALDDYLSEKKFSLSTLVKNMFSDAKEIGEKIASNAFTQGRAFYEDLRDTFKEYILYNFGTQEENEKCKTNYSFCGKISRTLGTGLMVYPLLSLGFNIFTDPRKYESYLESNLKMAITKAVFLEVFGFYIVFSSIINEKKPSLVGRIRNYIKARGYKVEHNN